MAKLACDEWGYEGVLEGFRDVLAADATVVKLHRLLARRFPGTRTNSSPAAAKLHLVMSVRGGDAHTVKVSGSVIARRLESMLLNKAPDPNRSRRFLVERVERGAAWA